VAARRPGNGRLCWASLSDPARSALRVAPRAGGSSKRYQSANVRAKVRLFLRYWVMLSVWVQLRGLDQRVAGRAGGRAEGVGGMSEPVLADKVLVQVVSAEPGRADPRDHDLICGDGGEHEDAHAEDH
jgi:hypothetical protein